MTHNEIVRKTSVIITLNTAGIELSRVLSHQICNMSLNYSSLKYISLKVTRDVC